MAGTRSHGIFLLFLITLAFLPLYAQNSPVTQTRALWVTRWDYRSAADLERIVKNAAAAHFNMLLFQIRGNGTVFYRSQIECWAEEFDFKDPGWDPLATAIELAHKNGLQLHAWVNVYPGWKGLKPPSEPSQLFNAHPDWFMKDPYSNTAHRIANYYWLSPTHPEVQDYLLKLFAEIYKNYEVDGLHLDYFRFPGAAYSYDDASLQLFKLKYGIEPEDNQRLWAQWREQAITSFLEKLHSNIKSYDPRLIVSCAVISDYERGVRLYRQNSHQWLARGIADILFPMIYTQDDTLFKNLLFDHLLNSHGRHVYPGIMAKKPDNLINQIKTAGELGAQGMAIFSYKNLFNNPQNALVDVLKETWTQDAFVTRLPWLDYYGDSQGPAVVAVRTIPVTVRNGMRFKIAAQIIDPSGVYDDDTGADGQGVYLVYSRTWPPVRGKEITMSRIKGSKNWFMTDQAIPPQKTGLGFRCRIYAWDDYHESATHPKRNLGMSDVWSLSILAPNQTYVSRGAFGPVLWRPERIEVAPNGSIWISSTGDDHVLVIQPDGDEAPFSPILYGKDGAGQSVRIQDVTGLAFLPPNIMCITSTNPDSIIYRFNISTGEPLPGIELDFFPSELACDRNGNLFVMEHNSGIWHVLNSAGLELQGSPFGVEHTGNDIAVLDDAQMVFISDRTSGTVQCWKGAIEGLRARYWRVYDLPDGDIGLGKVAVDSSDYIYVSHANRGIITIYNRIGKAVEHLSGGNPLLNSPREIGVSVTADSLYVLETTGVGPTRLSLWIREKK